MAIYEGKFDKQFNTENWKEESIKFKHNGKAPKIFGEGVFRFNAPITFWSIMSKRGWQVIKKSSYYVYLKPTEPPVDKYFQAVIKTPSDEQIIEIANSLKKERKPVAGLLGEWPFFFIYEQKVKVSILENQVETEKIVEREYSGFNINSYMVIGENNIWRKNINFRNGKFEVSDY